MASPRRMPAEIHLPRRAASQAKVKGNVSITMNLSGETGALQRGDLSNAEGVVKLLITNAEVEAQILSPSPLRFDKISADVAMEKGKMDIKSISLNGPELTGKASGSVKIDPNFLRSQIQGDVQLTVSEKAGQLRGVVTALGSQAGLHMDEHGVMAMKISGPFFPPEMLRVQGY